MIVNLRNIVWTGPLTAFGFAVTAIVFLLDQALKNWLLYIYHLASRGEVAVTAFLDLILTWNKGISYGLFPQGSMVGQYALAAFKVIVSLGLFLWLARVQKPLLAFAIGLIAGGALGNALDRLVYGGVVDFFSLHFGSFYWYIFNVADIAIVAGVGLLLIESFLFSSKGT